MARPLLRSLLYLCLIFTRAFTLHAERLPIKIYTSADGLGSSFVDFMMPDSRGFMWFCTRDGLSRFDGARFITYRVGDKNSPPGIEGLYQTRDGTYWITTTAGMYRFKADAVSQTTAAVGDRPILNAQFVGSGRGPLLEDHNGTLWYASDDLYLVREQNGQFRFEPKKLNIPSTPSHPFDIFQIREAPDGSIWLNTNQGVVRYLPDGRRVLYRHEIQVRSGLASMVIEPGGRVWTLWRNELFVINPAPLESVPEEPLTIKTITPSAVLSASPGRQISLPHESDQVIRLVETSENPITGRLYQSRDSHIWLVADKNLFEFDGHKFLVHGKSQGLPAGMGEMAEDSAGNLWIGGRTIVVRLDRKGLVSFGEADGLGSKTIQSIIEAADGTLYLVNGDFSLSRFDGEHFQNLRAQVAPDARALWTSRAAFLSSANEWWFLTTTKLYRFSAGNLKIPLATLDSHNGFNSDEMFQMFEDSHGDLWLSQQPSRDENFGLYRLKKGEKNFYRFTQADGLPDGKAAESFAEDRNGNLWFGFYEGGLVRFANDRFTQFTTTDGVPFGLITDLLIDRQGRLWMSSTNSGVARIDDPGAAKPQFVSLTTEQGLSSNNARTITEDLLGNIYVGTVRGVDQISPDSTRFRHYSVNDGLAGDFVVDSHCDRVGNLWFATTNGLSRLSPGQAERLLPPTIWLGGLRIAGEKQPLSELGNAEVSKGKLAYTQNNFQIDFFGLDFHAGETLRYQFMLEGADSQWSAPTEQRTVTYANLRPGSYRFLVRAVNSDGTQSDRPAVLSFTILPPIWLRWWVLSLAGLLTVSLFYLFYWYRMARLREVNTALAEAKRAEEALGRAREERLAELARVRTRIATDLHDDIGASLTQIAILSEVAKQQQRMKDNGASIAPLESIANTSNELVESMSDIVWAINPQKDQLRDLIHRMRRFASDLLLAKGIELEFNAPEYEPEIPLGANPRREVFLIFKESLANIVKHAKARQVKIDLVLSTESLRLTITDDGKGFDPLRTEAMRSSEQKGGHGFGSMKKRAHEMRGKFEVNSRIGAGTTIEFELPLSVNPTTPQTNATFGD